MFGRFKHFIAHVRITSSYTDAQKKQFESLRGCFQKAFNKPTANTPLDVDASGLPKLTTTELAKYIPEKINFTSPLTPYINGILSEIAAYLNERAAKFAQYPNDPTNLLCFQLIQWLESTLAKAACTKDLLDEVNQWIHYFQLIQSEKVFSTAESGNITHTLDALLVNTLNLLDRTKNYIKFEINRLTISDYIGFGVNKGSDALNLTFDFIARILSDDVIPPNFSLINLYNPILRSDLEKILTQTQVGEYYLNLVANPYLQELFFPNQCQFEHIENCLLEDTSSKSDDQTLRTPSQSSIFLNERGEAATQILELFSSQNVTNSPNVKKKILGLQINLAQDERLVGGFVKTLGLLDTLAKVLLNLREAGYLAKSGGELLICTLTREQLEYLITSFNKLVKEILKQLRTIAQVTKNSYNMFYKQDKKSNSVEQWMLNYESTQRIYDQIIETFTKSQEHITQINNIIQNIAERMLKTKNLLTHFISEVNVLANDYPWLGPYQLEGQMTLPKISAVHEQPTLQSAATNVRKSYQGKRGNTMIDFIEIEIAKDSENGFTALTLKVDEGKVTAYPRNEVIGTIQEFSTKEIPDIWSEKDKEYIRNLIASEIEYVVLEKWPFFPKNFALSNLCQEGEKHLKLKNAGDAWASLVKLEFKVPEEILRKGNDAILNWAQQQKTNVKKLNEIINDIVSWRKEFASCLRLIKSLCITEETCQAFLIEFYLQEHSNPTGILYLPNKQKSLLDGVAEVLGNNLCIWRLNEFGSIEFEREYLNSRQSTNTVHLLVSYKSGKQVYFNRLVTLDDPLLNVEFESPVSLTSLSEKKSESTITIEEIDDNNASPVFEKKSPTMSSAEITAKQHTQVFNKGVEKKPPTKVLRRDYSKITVKEKIPKLDEDKYLRCMTVLSGNTIACGYALSGSVAGTIAEMTVPFFGKAKKAIEDNIRKNIYIWNLENHGVRYLSGYSGFISSLVALNEGNWLASIAGENIIILDVASGNILRTLKNACPESSQSKFARERLILWKTKDNRELLVVGGHENIKIWDPNTTQCIKTLHGSGNSALAIISENCLASCGSSKEEKYSIQLWNLETAQCINNLKLSELSVLNLAPINPNKFASIHNNGKIRIWDINSGKCLQVFKEKSGFYRASLLAFDDHLISISGDSKVRMWNLNTGKKHVLLDLADSKKSPISIIALSILDRDQLLCGAANGSIHKITLPIPELVDAEDEEKNPEAASYESSMTR